MLTPSVGNDKPKAQTKKRRLQKTNTKATKVQKKSALQTVVDPPSAQDDLFVGFTDSQIQID